MLRRSLLALTLLSIPVDASAAVFGAWTVDRRPSVFGDKDTVLARVTALRGLNSGIGGRWPALFVRCEDGDLQMWVHWDIFISTENQQLDMRVDRKTAWSVEGAISTSHQATATEFSQDELVLVFDEMRSGKVIRFGVTPYGENPVVAAFSLSGFTKAIAPVLEACRDNP